MGKRHGSQLAIALALLTPLWGQSWHLEPVAYHASPLPEPGPMGDGPCHSLGADQVQCGKFTFELRGREIFLVKQEYTLLANSTATQGPSTPPPVLGPAPSLPPPVTGRVVIRASKLPSTALRGLVGGGNLVAGASVFEGNACLLDASAVSLTSGQIYSALVGTKLPVISRGSAQAAANLTRSKKLDFLTNFAQVGPGVATAAVGLAATGTIKMNSQWVAGISLAAWGIQTLVDVTKNKREEALAPLQGLWLDDVSFMQLTPTNPCTPLFRYMSTFHRGKQGSETPDTVTAYIQ